MSRYTLIGINWLSLAGQCVIPGKKLKFFITFKLLTFCTARIIHFKATKKHSLMCPKL